MHVSGDQGLRDALRAGIGQQPPGLAERIAEPFRGEVRMALHAVSRR